MCVLFWCGTQVLGSAGHGRNYAGIISNDFHGLIRLHCISMLQFTDVYTYVHGAQWVEGKYANTWELFMGISLCYFKTKKSGYVKAPQGQVATHRPLYKTMMFKFSDVHHIDVNMSSLTIVYSTIYWGANQRKHQSSSSLAFVQGIHRWPVNSPHKGPVTRKMFPFDDVIVIYRWLSAGLQYLQCVCNWDATVLY